MPELRVPPEYREGLLFLADLNDVGMKELAATLEANPDVLMSKNAARDVSGKLRNVKPDVGYKIIEAIVPLMFTKASHPERIDSIVADISDALSTGGTDESRLTGASAHRFEENFRKLMQLPALGLKAKAISVATDVPHLFSEVKILTDMRPVFGEDPAKPPLGAVILHDMRITYATDGEAKELFVTLDTNDLEQIVECAARALDKDKALRAFIESSRLQLFETSD